MRSNLQKMKTQANGRRPLQHVYLWKKAGCRKYSVQEDGPHHGICPVLPSQTELLEEDNTREYLEVGLVFGDEPSKLMPNSPKPLEDCLSRTAEVLRVFIPIWEDKPRNAQLYIGCRPKGGHLHARRGQLPDVFFYSEFWAGISDIETLNIQVRRKRIAEKLKYHATIKQHIYASPNVTARRDDTDNAISTTAGLEHDPQTSAEGMAAFMAFGKDLSDDHVSKLIDEIKVRS